jgi:two-component system response regulator MprA
MRVLLVEDDPAVRGAVERALRGAGHQADLAAEGDRALTLVRSTPYDAVVLDLGLPGLDGLEVCRRMRDAGDRTPVLMMTARAAVAERVEGLDAGADDYLVKPFALDELLARLRAFQRRAKTEAPARGLLRFADLELDRDTTEARRGERRIQLTRTEYLLLELFLSNPEHVLKRDVIFDRVWGYDFGPDSNSLDVYIGYLRRKLESAGEPRLLHTVRGVGYVLRSSP